MTQFKLTEPTEEEYLAHAEEEELFLFAAESDYLAIANAVWELFVNKHKAVVESEPVALTEFAKQPIGKILKGGEIDLYDTLDIINEMEGFEIFIHPQHAIYAPRPSESARIAELDAKLNVARDALKDICNPQIRTVSSAEVIATEALKQIGEA